MVRPIRVTWIVALASLSLAAPVWAVKPAEDLLPETTCLFVSFPEMETFEESFKLTQLGQLATDPVMQPFAEDFAKQVRDRFGKTDLQLGLKWEDLEGVYAGEACLARVQPGNKKGEHAVALLVDVTNKEQQVKRVRATVDANMKQRKAKRTELTIGGAAVTAYEMEKQIGELKPREVFLTVVNDQLFVTNHKQLVTDVISRANDAAVDTPSLSDNQIFGHIDSEVKKSSGNLIPHVRWFVDPFKYAQVIRSSRGGRKRRGKDFSQILQDQGFDAIRALGGHVNLATNEHEILHRTLVYAPPVTDQPTKYNAAARLLDFPAGKHLPLPNWVPRDMATFLSFNWNVLDGFNYSISLIDEIVDSPGFVEDVLDSFKFDKTGPMIDIRAALLEHLDSHILMFSDFDLPITTKSERLLFAVRVKDEAKVKAALKQLWQNDPQANAVEIEEHVVWEIIPDEVGVDDIELPGTVPLGGNSDGGDEIKLPNSAMTVSRGPDPQAPAYLFITTDVNLLRSVLDKTRPKHDTLAASADFQIVNKLLNQLGAGQDSFRFFSRTDEEYRSAYEMIRQGKMPESESMLGRVLNRMLGPEEDDVLRKPEIDGAKLPDYQIVRRYLGPAGLFVQPRDDGWLVTGIMVSKQKMTDDDALVGELTSTRN